MPIHIRLKFTYAAAAFLSLAIGGSAFASPKVRRVRLSGPRVARASSVRKGYSSHFEMTRKVRRFDPSNTEPLKPSSLARVPLSALKPTQSEYGGALVKANIKTKLATMRRRQITPIAFVKNRQAAFEIPTVVSPTGEVYVLDSHHGVLTNLRLLEKTKTDPDMLIKVIRDFRGKSERGFIEGVFGDVQSGGMGKGQFLRQNRGKDLEARFRGLPSTFGDMTDNPYRSLVGAALSQNGVEAKLLVDYAEFVLIDELFDRGAFPLQDNSFGEASVRLASKVLFASGSMREFVSSLARKSDDKSLVEAQVASAANTLNQP